MGWKGTVRSINAAVNAAERDAQRRHKAMLKEEMIADAEDAVSSWEDYIDDLTSIHTDLADSVDWEEIVNTPEPQEPKLSTVYQDTAAKKLEEFKPRFFDFLSGGSDKKRNKLLVAVEEAPQADQDQFHSDMTAYRKALKEWEDDTDLGRRLLAGEEEAIVEVIKEMQSFANESLMGSKVSFSVEDGQIHAKPEVHTDEIVPSFRRKQLASGKLSETKMPQGQFNELYQDYVCSVALRVAGDLFQFLPFDEVYVTCQATMLNSKTGHQELSPILSAQFIRASFTRLNLDNIDPSDSMSNFNHVMSFKKTKGFQVIEPLVGDS